MNGVNEDRNDRNAGARVDYTQNRTDRVRAEMIVGKGIDGGKVDVAAYARFENRVCKNGMAEDPRRAIGPIYPELFAEVYAELRNCIREVFILIVCDDDDRIGSLTF